MPLTVPAHQSIVLPLKIWAPRRFDGTALFIAAAAPDLAYAFGNRTHTVRGVLIWVVPFTLVACWLLRWRAAAGVFAQFPDVGRFRLRSYRVLSSRSPALFVTLSSTLVGGFSHILLDAFTHPNRWGAKWTGTNDILLSLPIVGQRTATWLMQYTGHALGTIAGILLLFYIGNARLLEQWYSEVEVRLARSVSVRTSQRLVFWGFVGVIAGAASYQGITSPRHWVFYLFLGSAVGLICVGSLPLWSEPEQS